MKKALRLKYLILLFPLIIAGIVVGRMSWVNAHKVALPTGELVSPEELRTQEVLKILATHTNKQLPKKMNPETMLQSIEGREGELVYHYVKINASSEQFDRKKFTAKKRPQLIYATCHSPRLHIFLANGVTARYSFKGKDGQLISEITIAPSECGY